MIFNNPLILSTVSFDIRNLNLVSIDIQRVQELVSESRSPDLSCRVSSSRNKSIGTSLEVQWLRLHASNAGGTCSIPGWGTKIPHAAWHGQKKKKKERKAFMKTLKLNAKFYV